VNEILVHNRCDFITLKIDSGHYSALVRGGSILCFILPYCWLKIHQRIYKEGKKGVELNDLSKPTTTSLISIDLCHRSVIVAKQDMSKKYVL